MTFRLHLFDFKTSAGPRRNAVGPRVVRAVDHARRV